MKRAQENTSDSISYVIDHNNGYYNSAIEDYKEDNIINKIDYTEISIMVTN